MTQTPGTGTQATGTDVEDRAELRSQQRAELRKVALILSLPIAAAIVLLGASAVERAGSPRTPDALADVHLVPVDSREHRDGPIAYDLVPPAGGAHAPTWQNCGFYDAPVPDERAVHSMERGAAWIAYDPSLPAEDRARLASLAGRSTHVLVSPRQDLPAPVVASAWGRQLHADGAGDPALVAFVDAYADGPQSPPGEEGRSCSEGEGTPVS